MAAKPVSQNNKEEITEDIIELDSGSDYTDVDDADTAIMQLSTSQDWFMNFK